MRVRHVTIATMVITLCGCGQSHRQDEASANSSVAPPSQQQNLDAIANAPLSQAPQPPEAAPPAQPVEPSSPLQPAPPPPPPPAPPSPPLPTTPTQSAAATDPKSVDAALDVARQFAGLLGARKFDKAYAMLGGRGGFASLADFKRVFAPYAGLVVTLHDTPPPDAEGAAGSIYVSVPAELSGMVAGRRVHHPVTITLRRVNDVPGSTEAQRRWHIEKFEDSAT